MTNIEKIKQARQEMDTAFAEMHRDVDLELPWKEQKLDLEALQVSVLNLVSIQADALRQATEVADENFERAQKLSDQVQENVRHIERLAERRSNSDQQILEALGSVANRVDAFVEAERAMPLNTLQICQDKLTIALALTKGEAV